MADEDGNETPAKKLKLDPECGKSGLADDKTKPDSTETPTLPANVPTQEENPPQAAPSISDDDVDVENEDDTGGHAEPAVGTGEGDMEDSSSDSSDVSELSDLAGEDLWKAQGEAPGGINWVYSCMQDGVDPRSILTQLLPDESSLPPDLDDLTLWKIVISIVSEPPPRKKLENYNTLQDAVNLIKTCKKIIVLTGAGVSVSCGIPDFRSKNGIYARLAVDFPDLPDPQAMFDIRYFRREQRPFFKFAKEIYPGQFEPSKSHKFIQMIEHHGKLLRNYTQNIDTLEQVAGIKNVIQCHGSFATATCMACKHKVSSDVVKEDVLNQVIPRCPKCESDTVLNVMKPDIVFFGESLPEEFHDQMAADKNECDLLIVIGSSLKVRPVALIPNSLPEKVPQILINKEHLRNLNFDIELLGDCDTIVGELCHHLGNSWSSLATATPMTQILQDELPTPPTSPSREDTLRQLPGEAISSDQSGEKIVSETDKQKVTNVTSGKDSVIDTSEKSQKSTADGTDITVDSSSSKSDSKPDHGDIASGSQNENGKISNSKNKDSDRTVCMSGTADSDNKHIDSSNGSNTETSTSESCKTEISSDAIKTLTSTDGSKTVSSTSDLCKTESSTSDESKTETSFSDAPKTGTLSSDVSKPETSRSDKLAASTEVELGSGEPVASSSGAAMQSGSREFRGWWRPARQNLALRLKDDQYCFIPPHQYIFPHAEFMVRLTSTDGPKSSASPGKYDLDRTYTTTESSYDGDMIDLMSNESLDGSDDEESRQRMKSVDGEGSGKSRGMDSSEGNGGQVEDIQVVDKSELEQQQQIDEDKSSV